MRQAVLSLFAAVALVRAQQAVWQQCGGSGWTGVTTCVSGTTCTVLNPYYSQCIPSSSSTAAPSSSSTVASSTTTSAGASPTGVNYWFSFGDSYTQTGFDPNSTLPTASNPFGNPPYPGWTSAGGANWVGFDTIKYNKSLLLTYNYAYGGATIDSALVPPYTSTVLSMTDQVTQFLNGAAKKPSTSPWTSTNALFSFWIGINDIGNSWYQSGDRDAFSDTLLDAYFALVQKLYNTGARNFLFINVPPVDRSPLMLAQSASSQATEKTVITGFNTKLKNRAAAFQSANSGVKTWLWDSNAYFTTILNSPTTYGFVDATSYGNTGDFWLNDLHPTSPAHELFAQQIANVLTGTVW